MKSIYISPEIVYEDFSLSTNIAGNCESIVGNPTQGTCAVQGTGGVAVFDGTVSACVFTPGSFGQPEDKWDGFCYHVPIESQSLFNS